MRSVIPLQSVLERAEWINEHDVELVFQVSPSAAKSNAYLTLISRVESTDTAFLTLQLMRAPSLLKASPCTRRKSIRLLRGLYSLHQTYRTTLNSSIPLPDKSLVCSTRTRDQRVLVLTMSEEKQQIAFLPRTNTNGTIQEKRSSFWSASGTGVNRAQSSVMRRITSILPIELTSIVMGCGETQSRFNVGVTDRKLDDGNIRKTSVNELVCPGDDSAFSLSGGIGCAILSLFAFKNIRSGRHFIVGGGDDGSINFWELE